MVKSQPWTSEEEAWVCSGICLAGFYRSIQRGCGIAVIGGIQNASTRAWATCSDWTSDLHGVERGSSESLWNTYNMLKSCSHLQYPFPSQLPPNLTAPIQPSLASSKPQSRSPSLSLENNALPVLNWILAFITKLNGICMPSESWS